MACAMGQQLKGEFEDGADVDIGRPRISRVARVAHRLPVSGRAFDRRWVYR